MSDIVPLNGILMHPLSDHARNVLNGLYDAPAPAQSFNPGVVNRLTRENLVEVVKLPSPYKTHKGKLINFLKITTAGIKATKG